MNYDEFLTSQRWQILEIISKSPDSPVSISEKIGTSIAYVSQQLKLLEAASIVSKKKTGEVEKGKPRSIYSISNELLYITALVKNTPLKKHIIPTTKQKITLRIWVIENKEISHTIEKLFWLLEEQLEKISGIYFQNSTKPKLHIISDDKKIKSIVSNFQKDFENKIQIEIHQKNTIKNKEEFHIIYDVTS